MTCIRYIMAALLFLGSVSGQNKTGSVVGTVTDLETHEVLIGANVVLKSADGKDTPYGIATDINGRFLVRNVPAGPYKLRTSYIGYQPFETDLFTLHDDSTYTFVIHLDPYYGKTAEEAREDIRKGIIRIYVWAGMISYSKAHAALAEQYGFEIGVIGCTPFQTDRYDAVMIQHLASRNGKDWFERFRKEWDRIKWP